MNMNDREKRLVIITAIGLSVYLILFFGKDFIGGLEKNRIDYLKMEKSVKEGVVKLRPYSDRSLLLEKLRQKMNLEVRNQDPEKLVALTSLAIQQTAKTSGINIGPLRESRGTGISSLKFEANGKYESMVKFMRGIATSGYPVIIDSMQMNMDPSKKGTVKLNLSIGIIDFNKYKAGGGNA